MSSSLVSSRWNASRAIIDHWRALNLPNVTSLFAELDRDRLRTMTHSSPDEQRTLCDVFVDAETDAEAGESCRDGIYREAPCRQHHSKCAILLSSYPGRSAVMRIYLERTRG
jgi:hypothetical protein